MSASTNRSSTFGQMGSFGDFGSTLSQSSPFRGSFQQQQTQPAFGRNQLGSSTPFYATSQPAFGATSCPASVSTRTPAFGSMSTSAFCSTTTPAFDVMSTPAFGSNRLGSSTPFYATSQPAFIATSSPASVSPSTPAFGAMSTPAFRSATTPAFRNTDSAFGVSSAPAFGSGGAFGASSTPGFGASNTTPFGSSHAPTFGSPSTTPLFSFGSPTPAFGLSASSFGGSPFSSTPSPFGAQSSPFGAQATTPAIGSTSFGQSTFGGQRGGSRAAAYSPTAEVDFCSGKQLSGKLESISAMPAYKDKSHEELRWEDYQLGDKGGPNRVLFANAGSFGATAEAAGTFGKSSTNPVSYNTAFDPFFQNRQTFGSSTTSGFGSSPFGASSTTSGFGSSPFGASSTTNPFGANSSPSASLFGAPSSNSAYWVPLNICAYGLDSLLLIAFGQSASSPFGFQPVFGQSASSPFGFQPVFGQTSASNPFVPNPFGSTNPFGSQTGASIFGGTSTGVFGATQSSSPLASTPTFGAASTTPAFGSSVPVFGSTPNSFGGSSAFGQKPAFGGFGSAPSQSSPFGSSFQQQQTQPAFRSLFGSSTPFYATTQPAFGSSISSPAFRSTSTPAFGAMSTPAFGSTTTTPAFGSTGSAFGVASAPAFGSGGAFGASSTPGFCAPSTPAFGASNTIAFGCSPTPTFGSSSTNPSFSFGSPTPAFGLSASSFGSSPFGSIPSPFGAQSSPFGSQATTPAIGSMGFGHSTFGGQRGGSRAAVYSPTVEVDFGSGTQLSQKLESISAMPVYKDKSHEELRWEDYRLGDKGVPNSAQSANVASFSSPAGAVQSTPFGITATFGQSSTNPFSFNTASTHSFKMGNLWVINHFWLLAHHLSVHHQR